MREIEFRAWDIKNKVMRKVIRRIDWLISGEPIRVFWVESEIEDGVGVLFGDGVLFGREFILEQYTGLKDKNGKKIFEGDIVRHQKVGGLRGPKNDRYEVGEIKIEVSRGIVVGNWPIGFEAKVIGNQHENQELMEQ
jgi:uncharacterized phage protein (TIGR01671 family)